MKKFSVRFIEEHYFETEVEAEDEFEAQEAAAKLPNSEMKTGNSYVDCIVEEV